MTRSSHAVPPAELVDILNSLLEADLNSIFRFMGESSPYLSRASAAMHEPLVEMFRATDIFARELVELIEHLGGSATPALHAAPDEPYLAYLSMKFLLPKLVHAKELCIERYENAIGAIGPGAPPEVLGVLSRQLAAHHRYLKILSAAVAGPTPAMQETTG